MFKEKFYVICHNIRSLHNVGSIFRTADGAGVDKVYLTGYTGYPPRKEISKVALRAEECVRWERRHDTWRVIENLKKEGVKIIALEAVPGKSIDYRNFKPKFPLALMLGNEVRGISTSLLKRSDHIIHLPMHGKKKSLNVSVAFGIAAYEINSTRR